MPSFITLPLLFVFPAFMAFAACSDLITMKITNKLVLGLLASFFIVALVAGMPLQTIGLHVSAGLLMLAISFGLFALNWIGGGDAKLIAATSLWFGFTNLFQFLLLGALFGGALTLALLAVRRMPLPVQLKTVTWIDRLHDGKTGVPYGIALAAAGLIVYPGSTMFQLLIG
jgi:prepilin peptidase CpaA